MRAAVPHGPGDVRVEGILPPTRASSAARPRACSSTRASACPSAMAEPLAAAVLGGGTMGLMIARLLVLDGREIALCDPHPERRSRAEALGARAVAALTRPADGPALELVVEPALA